MECFGRRMCSSSNSSSDSGTKSSSSSSSGRLLWFMVPLVLVPLLILFSGSKASDGVLAFHYNPPTWSSVTSSSSCSSSYSCDDLEEKVDVESPVSSPSESSGGKHTDLQLQPRVVEGGNKHNSGDGAAALSEDYNLSRSATPPLAVEPVDTQPQHTEGLNQENLNTSNPPLFFPSLNKAHSFPTSKRLRRNDSNLNRLEIGLARARAAVKAAVYGNKTNDGGYIPKGPIYLNPNVFHRSYLEMEKQFKIFVYEEGEKPIFHDGPCKSTYAMEGNFISFMETTQFRTRDANKAHVFFLPISVTLMVRFIYERDSHNWKPLRQTVRDYVNFLAKRHSYWNRSVGADHFMLSCHDWGPKVSSSVPNLFKNSIRALCNANTSEGFKPSKDVSFPEILLPEGTMKGLTGGPSASKRPILVFFAGGLHGPIRPLLLEQWENKDEDVQVHRYLQKGVSYYDMLRKSKYCICPSGYEVASPRMVEAIYTGCVPVLIKDHYVPPFSDVLNWKAFSVEIQVKDIPNLKKILMGISPRQYIRMQRRVLLVRRHFEVHSPPKRYDVFHMILHSVWLRRLNIRVYDNDEL